MIASAPDTFVQLENEISGDIGFRLFTVLLVDLPDVVRVHSSNPREYAVTGRKRMGPTPWGAHVIAGGKPWLGLVLSLFDLSITNLKFCMCTYDWYYGHEIIIIYTEKYVS